MRKVEFEYDYKSIDEIKKIYFLNELCYPVRTQVNNIAITIQSLFYYYPQLQKSNVDSLTSILSKTINILSYSVIDGIVILLGIKMQKKCEGCHNKDNCKYYSNSIFAGKSKDNELNAFVNAKKHLEKCKIINLSDHAKNVFKEYRDIRNYVHITRNGLIMTKDDNFTKEKSRDLLNFLQYFVKHLYNNYQEFLKNNNCK